MVLKRKLISSFKAELKRITKDENRRIFIKKAGERSIFVDLIDDETIKNELGLYNAKTHWDKANIEFYLNENDDNEYFKDLKEFPEDYIHLKSILKYIARHEYGHTFITPNLYEQKPKEEREILKKVGVNNFKDVPKGMKQEIFEKIKNTAFYKCVEELQNVELTILLKEFKEFHANYTVLTQIDDSIPNEILRWNYNQLEPIIRNLHSRKEEIIVNIKSRENYRILKRREFFYLLFEILSITYEIYIFSEWDQLIPLFRRHNMLKTLYFTHLINEIFKSIANSDEDFDLMIENVMDVGRIIDPIDFEELIFRNQITGAHLNKLIDYKKKLDNQKVSL